MTHPVGAWEWPLIGTMLLGPPACWAIAGLLFANGKISAGLSTLLVSAAIPFLVSIIWDTICIDRTMAAHLRGDHRACKFHGELGQGMEAP